MSNTLGGDFALVLGLRLDELADQVRGYPSDEALWAVAPGTRNSGGTLALHMVGNLEHFVGSVLGASGYVRDREAEFGERGIARDQILDRIRRCRDRVTAALDRLADEDVQTTYPGALPPQLPGASTHLLLVHLATHLAWHLGQVDYHRRILGAAEDESS